MEETPSRIRHHGVSRRRRHGGDSRQTRSGHVHRNARRDSRRSLLRAKRLVRLPSLDRSSFPRQLRQIAEKEAHSGSRVCWPSRRGRVHRGIPHPRFFSGGLDPRSFEQRRSMGC